MKMRPVIFTWTPDGTMVPLDRFRQVCDRQFVVHAEYPLIVVEARNMKSHNHYFACIHTAWENLPEKYAKKWPTPEALRAKALVETHWCTERDHVCDGPGNAKYLAGIIRHYSDYSVIRVSGNIVKVFEPVSQSVALMSPDDFKQSKDDVLDWIEALNPGLPIRDIKKEAAKITPPEKKPSLAAAVAQKAAASIAERPSSAPAYFAYARTWIFKAVSKAEAGARWDAERELRDELRVSIPNRRELEKLLAAQFNQAEAMP